MKRLFSCLCFVIVAGLPACNKPEQQGAEQQDLTPVRAALSATDKKIQDLTTQLAQLEDDNQRLRSENEFLRSQTAVMNPRLQQIISWYGTGIWDYREDINAPEFVRSLKGEGAQAVIAGLNERFRADKQPNLIMEKKEGSTIYVSVDNEELLSEGMGSSGAVSYMTSVIYSLVSVKDIDCVIFDVGEGEHAGPGKYCRDELEPLVPE